MAWVGDDAELLSLSLLVCTHFDDVITYVGLQRIQGFRGLQRLTKYSSRKTCESNFNRINGQSIGPARLHNPNRCSVNHTRDNTLRGNSECHCLFLSSDKIPRMKSPLPGRSYFLPTPYSINHTIRPRIAVPFVHSRYKVH